MRSTTSVPAASLHRRCNWSATPCAAVSSPLRHCTTSLRPARLQCSPIRVSMRSRHRDAEDHMPGRCPRFPTASPPRLPSPPPASPGPRSAGTGRRPPTPARSRPPSASSRYRCAVRAPDRDDAFAASNPVARLAVHRHRSHHVAPASQPFADEHLVGKLELPHLDRPVVRHDRLSGRRPGTPRPAPPWWKAALARSPPPLLPRPGSPSARSGPAPPGSGTALALSPPGRPAVPRSAPPRRPARGSPPPHRAHPSKRPAPARARPPPRQPASAIRHGGRPSAGAPTKPGNTVRSRSASAG